MNIATRFVNFWKLGGNLQNPQDPLATGLSDNTSILNWKTVADRYRDRFRGGNKVLTELPATVWRQIQILNTFFACGYFVSKLLVTNCRSTSFLNHARLKINTKIRINAYWADNIYGATERTTVCPDARLHLRFNRDRLLYNPCVKLCYIRPRDNQTVRKSSMSAILNIRQKIVSTTIR